MAGADALAAQTAEAVGSVALPAPRSTAIDLAWWGGLLTVAVGLGLGGVVLAADGSLVVSSLLVLVGIALAGWAASARRRRAAVEAEAYAEAVHARVESIIERGLASPARQVLERHRALQRAVGL